MSFADNLKMLMKKNKMTALDIADKLELTRAAVTNWSNGIRFPKDEETIKALASILRVSVAELFGENERSSSDGMSMLPVVNVYAGAGAEGTVPDYITSKKIPVWSKFLNGVNPKNLSILQVVGDSMTPTINPEDWVIIDMANGRLFHEVDGIYLINKDGSIQIKRLHFKGNRGVDIISDNKEYRVENTIDDGIDLFVIGKLYRHIRTLGALAIKE